MPRPKQVTIREKDTSEEKLQDAVAEFVNNPLGFVYFAYDWGNGALENEEGPDEWQTDVLKQIGEKSITATEAIQIAVRSGHGIGKTALIAWIIHWFMSTRPFPQVVVTANTTTQLTSKTWREVAKWHKLAINSHWFKWTATKFYHVNHPEDWFAMATPWSKERSEAFAGTHEKYVLMVFDEASAIDDTIWDAASGAMTTDGAMWIVFGNPTRNTGRFSQCFKKFRHRWITLEIDSRTAKKANQEQIKQWIDDYGEDSDFVRVRVKGQEPRSGSMQLISNELVEKALGRSIHESMYYRMPKLIGIDIARQGDNQSVICKRQGMAVFDLIKLQIDDNMKLAARIAIEINEWRPDMVFIDQGAGVGVIDRLRQLGYEIVEVPFGSAADDDKHYANKRAEMWTRIRDYLKAGGCLPYDTELRDDLVGPEYGFQGVGDRIILERKKDMMARGLASPDCFVAGTKILTTKGQKNIEDVDETDYVITPFGVRRVLARWEDEVTELYEAVFSNGSVLKGKGKHKIFTNNGFIPLQKLKEEYIVSLGFKNLLKWRILCLRSLMAKSIGFQRLANIIMPTVESTGRESSEPYTEIYGNTFQAKPSQMGMIFTILTEIPKIIYSLILKSCQQVFMDQTIPRKTGRYLNTEKSRLTIYMRKERKQKSGILHRMVENGIRLTERLLGKTESLKPQFALTASQSIAPIFRQDQNFAQGNVLITVPTIASDTTHRQQYVNDVEENLWRTAIGRKDFVHTLARIIQESPVKVYNLTVDVDNVYYANGVLVSNCGDALALTFAYKIGITENRSARQAEQDIKHQEYDPFAVLGGRYVF